MTSLITAWILAFSVGSMVDADEPESPGTVQRKSPNPIFRPSRVARELFERTVRKPQKQSSSDQKSQPSGDAIETADFEENEGSTDNTGSEREVAAREDIDSLNRPVRRIRFERATDSESNNSLVGTDISRTEPDDLDSDRRISNNSTIDSRESDQSNLVPPNNDLQDLDLESLGKVKVESRGGSNPKDSPSSVLDQKQDDFESSNSTGELLDKAASVNTRRVSALNLDTTVRGYQARQIGATANGMPQLKSRVDIDTLFSQIDPGIVDFITVVDAPIHRCTDLGLHLFRQT